MPPRRRKTNRFSHAYTRNPEKAYTCGALRDFSLRSYTDVAPARQISKKIRAVTYLTLRSLKFPAIARPYQRARRRDRLIFIGESLEQETIDRRYPRRFRKRRPRAKQRHAVWLDRCRYQLREQLEDRYRSRQPLQVRRRR